MMILSAVGTATAQPAVCTNRGDDTVTIFEGRSLAVLGTVAVGAEPHDVVLSSDGQRAFVSNFAGGSISVVDLEARAEISRIPVGLGPHGLALSPDGTRLWVALALEDSLAILDASTLVRLSTVKDVSDSPTVVGFNRSGTEVWVVSVGSTHDVAIVDPVLAIGDPDNAVRERIIVGLTPRGLAFSLDGTKAWVTNGSNDDVSLISIPSHFERRIPVGLRPLRASLDPSGGKLYVSNVGDGTVSVIDTATDEVVDTIGGFDGPLGTAFSADGSFLYVANTGGTDVTRVSLADSASRLAVRSGASPGDLAIRDEPAIACRLGFVNARGPGGIVPVLFAHGSIGGRDRVLDVAVGEPLFLMVGSPPDGTPLARVALFVWRRAPTAATVSPQPYGLVEACLPTPLSGGSPQPILLVNSFGHEDRMGVARVGPRLAPFTLTIPPGIPRAGNFTVQAIVEDARGPNRRASFSNAIVLRAR